MRKRKRIHTIPMRILVVAVLSHSVGVGGRWHRLVFDGFRFAGRRSWWLKRLFVAGCLLTDESRAIAAGKH